MSRIRQLQMGSTLCKGKGRFGGLFSIFTMGNAIASSTVKYFRSVCENFTTFPFGKHIVGKLDAWAFRRYIQFPDQTWGSREISENVTTVLRNLTSGYSPPRRFRSAVHTLWQIRPSARPSITLRYCDCQND